VIATIGVAAGIGSTLALARLIAGMLCGLKAYDPMTFGASAVMLILIGLAGSGISARRAASLDAMRAPRHE
jgi:ABC-type antimicrobial peptide transport system permease subunit